MTVCRKPLIRWGLCGLALLSLGLDLGCSEFRARRRLGRSPAASSSAPSAATPIVGDEAPVTEGEIVTPPASGATLGSPSLGRSLRPAAPSSPLGEPPLDPDPLPTIGAAPTSGRANAPRSTGAVIPASASRVTLQPPIPAARAPQPLANSAKGSGADPGSVPAAAASSVAPIATPGTAGVVAEARVALDALASYQVNLHRQERVGGTLLPAEDLVMSIRRQPLATRLTWTDGTHRGREVLYRSDEPGGLMHVHMGDSKIPVPRMSLAPTSPLVMRNSRHPITEAGLDPLVSSLEAASRDGSLVDLGLQTTPPLDRPHRGLLRTTPEGEVWRVYLDPTTHLPALVDCRTTSGEVLELDHFRNLQANPAELASAAAFDPDARWGASRGLFGRVATRNDSSTSATSTR